MRLWERKRGGKRENLPIDMVRESLWDGIMREGGLRRKSCTQSTLDPCLLAKGLHHPKVPSASCSNIIRKTKVNYPHCLLTLSAKDTPVKARYACTCYDAPLMNIFTVMAFLVSLWIARRHNRSKRFSNLGPGYFKIKASSVGFYYLSLEFLINIAHYPKQGTCSKDN
jgi:hypothetical protein